MFNDIARNTILQFAAKYPRAANSLFEWYYEMLNASFKDFNELKQVFDYRVVQIKWFGTHSEYNKINVKLVEYKRCLHN